MKTYTQQPDGSLYIVHEDGRSTSIPAPQEGQEPHWLYASALKELEAGEAEIILA